MKTPEGSLVPECMHVDLRFVNLHPMCGAVRGLADSFANFDDCFCSFSHAVAFSEFRQMSESVLCEFRKQEYTDFSGFCFDVVQVTTTYKLKVIRKM